MPSEKLVPIDEGLYNELVDMYEDLQNDLERVASLEFGESGVDPFLVEETVLLIDKILTAYDYYSESEDKDEPSGS